MDENDLSNYVYIEDLDYDVDIFSYPCPPGFPLPHIAYCRKVRKISVVDCEAMTDLEFPLVLPHQEGFEQKLGKKKLHHPVLLLGELVPNKDKILDLDLSAQTILASSLPAIRIIVTDHFLERTEKEASTGGAALTLWVKDHEDVWYRLANSYHPKYRSMGERIVEMIRQCDLAKGIIPSYKICECAIAENAIMNGVKAADVMDAWSSVNSNKKTPSSGVSYIIEGLMLVDVSKGIFMKSYVSLNCLELLWPKVENGRAASLRLPCLLANKLFTLQGPDASYKPQVLKVAELLYGSGSVYKKPKRMPDSEEFFTVMDFVLCYDSLEEQQCAVQDISGSSTVVLRGRLKSISNRASNKTTLTFNIVAYLQDYYVDIDCSRTGAIGNNPRRIMLPHYFVRPMVCAGGCWFRLQRPSDYYYLYREPEDLITQVYTWPSEAKDEVWRRICNYEVSEGNCEKHIRVTAVSDSNYNKVVLKGELLSLPAETKTKQITFPEQQRALKVRLYPYKASIDFGDYVAVDNAGLWMSDLTGVWYKLCQPAAHAYSSMASIDICLVDATLALSSCLIYLNNRASKHVSVCTCGNDRRLTIDCSLSKLWELSEQAFDLKIINAESTLFQQYMSSRICFTESKLFCKSCGIVVGKNKEVDSFSAEALSSEEDINVHQPRLTAASIHRRKLLKVLTDKEKAASNQKINKKDSKNNKRASCGSDDDIGSTGNLQSGNMNVTGSSVAGDLFGKHQRRSFKHRRTQEDDEDEDMPLQTSSKPVHTKSLSNASESSDSAADFCRRGNSEGDHSRKTDVNPGDSIEAASTISAETKRIDKKQTVTWDMHSENGSEGRMEVQIIPAVSAPANTTRVGDEGIKSVREQTGFNDLGLCRHCRAVAKLPTCSNVLHKNGVRWVGAGLREPAALTKVLLSAPSSGHGAKALPIKPTPAIGLSDNLATAPLKQAVREVKQPSNVTPNLSSDAALSKPVGANVSAATLKFAALAANSAHHPLMSNFGSILPEKTSFSVSQFNLTLAKSSAEFMISKKQTVSDLRTGLDSTISEHSFTKTESADRDASTSDSPSTSVKMRFGLRAGDDKNGKASITSMFSPPSVAGTDQVYRSRLSGESYSEERGNAKQGDDYNYISTRMDVGRNFNTYRRDRAWEEDDRDRWGRSIRGTDSLPRDRPTEGHERNERERNEDRRAHLAREQRRSLSRERETANRERRRDGQDRSKSPEYYKRRDRARSKSRSRSRSRSRYRSTSRSWTRGRDRRERRGREEDSSDDRTYGAKVSNSASLISRETPSIYKKLCNYCRGLAKLNGCRVIGHVDGDYFSSSRQAESGLCSYCHSLKKLFRCRFPHHKDGFGV